MSESKGSYWPYIVITLLCLVVGTLLSIEKELKAQRSPERIAAIEAQEKRENEAKQIMTKARKERTEQYKSTPWSEISGDDYVNKFLAHDYHLWLLLLAVVAAGPALRGRATRGY